MKYYYLFTTTYTTQSIQQNRSYFLLDSFIYVELRAEQEAIRLIERVLLSKKNTNRNQFINIVQ